MSAPAMVLMPHAVTRFRQRHRPDLTDAEARVVLASLVPSAVKLAEKSGSGQDQWRIEDPPAILVTKTDPKVGGVVCITVLDAIMAGPTREELDELHAAYARLAPSYEVTPLPPRAATPAPASAKPAKKPKLAGPLRAAAHELEVKRVAEAKERKAKAHAAHQEMLAEHARKREAREADLLVRVEKAEAEKRSLKQALRFALRALEPRLATDPAAAVAWAKIYAIEPAWVSDGFLRFEYRAKPVGEGA